jgi:4'-phosphopantetheinyl transferase
MPNSSLTDSIIHVWMAQQDAFDLAVLEPLCLNWLTESERHRLNRLKLARHRQQFLLSRFMLRSVLSAYEPDIAPGDWRFVQNSHGKPALDPAVHDAGMHFNLSHSRGRLALAIARHPLLGVDIECSERERRVSRIASRYFSAQETGELLSLSGPARLARFYELWTLKEAYIKACGLGLAIPLQHFSFGFAEPDHITISFAPERADQGECWQFWQLDAGSDYRLALALKSESGRVCTAVKQRTFTPDTNTHANIDTGADGAIFESARILRASIF